MPGGMNPPRPVPADSLTQIGLDATTPAQGVHHNVIGGPGSVRAGNNVDVVEVSHQELPRLKIVLGFAQGSGDPEREKRRHQGIALFASLAVLNVMGNSILVLP